MSSSTVRTRRRRVKGVAMTAWLGLGSLLVLFPFYLVLVTALKDERRIFENPLGLPTSWHWGDFVDAWRIGHFGIYFRNSVLVVVPTVLVVLAFSLLAAYAFAQMRFRGSNILFGLLLFGLAVPLDVLIIPLFYEMLRLHLLSTIWALILPQVAVGLPFGVLLLRAFIQDLPQELLDAGRIDGCNRFRLLIHVVLPLCRPALLSLLVFIFMWTWNQFLLPLVLVQSDSARTLPIGLSFFQGRFNTDLPLLMAGVTITVLPVILVYIVFQRHIIRGMTAGALK